MAARAAESCPISATCRLPAIFKYALTASAYSCHKRSHSRHIPIIQRIVSHESPRRHNECTIFDMPGAETILVVDDELGVLSVMEMMLKRAGYRVILAAGAQ